MCYNARFSLLSLISYVCFIQKVEDKSGEEETEIKPVAKRGRKKAESKVGTYYSFITQGELNANFLY